MFLKSDETGTNNIFFKTFICSLICDALINNPLGHTLTILCNFVCVEVLRPSQPNGVMSSAVSLPNHTYTGQA